MKKTIIVIITLAALLFVLLYVSEKIFNKTIVEQLNSPLQEEAVLPILDIKEEYKNSTYTFAGEIDLPTPCHKIETKVNKISDVMYEIEVNTIEPSPDQGCVQVITPQKYKVSFEGPESVLVYAKIDDRVYELNRFVIPEGENIDTFELFIKG